MNLLEKIFFSMFLLYSRHRDEQEFTGINAIMFFGLALAFNIGTIVLLISGLGIHEFEPFLDEEGSKNKFIIIIIAWFSLLAFLFLKKSQLKRYRARIEQLSEDGFKRIKRRALAYIILSIVGGLVVAFSVTASLDG